MIAVIEQAPLISLSKNQIIYKFLATDSGSVPYGPLGASAEVTTNTVGYPVGDTLILSWTEPDGTSEDITFTAVATPALVTDILGQPSGLGAAAYFLAVARRMQAHPFVGPLFRVDAVQDGANWQIVVTALDTGPGWTVSFDISGVSGGSSPSTSSSAAVADNTPDNYELLIEVNFQTIYEGDFDKIAGLTGKPDKDGYITVNIAEILHKEIKSSFVSPPIPNFDNDEPLLANVIRKHYIRYRENYEGSTEDWSYLAIKSTLCGGIKKNLFADYAFFSSLDETNSILSWYPSGKTVSPDQPEYIAWYNYTGADAEVMLEVNMIEEDGTSTLTTRHNTSPITVGSTEILLIPVGYDQLDLASEGLDIKKYIVRVIEYQDPLITRVYHSQARAYYVDTCYYKDKRYIMYLNGFCVPETLRCIGEQDKDLSINREIAEQILPVSYQELDSETVQYDESYQNSFTYRSGYLSRWEVDALQELLIYNDAYEIHPTGYIPLLITDKKYKLYSTGDFLHSIQFNAVPRFIDRAYSNINIPLAAGQDAWAVAPGENWWEENSLDWIAP